MTQKEATSTLVAALLPDCLIRLTNSIQTESRKGVLAELQEEFRCFILPLNPQHDGKNEYNFYSKDGLSYIANSWYGLVDITLKTVPKELKV